MVSAIQQHCHNVDIEVHSKLNLYVVERCKDNLFIENMLRNINKAANIPLRKKITRKRYEKYSML